MSSEDEIPEEDLDCLYSSREYTEDMDRYTAGGYHPIIVGNILGAPDSSSSCRIVHKLGWGSFATVWLAERTTEGRGLVAIKVSTASGYSHREGEILRKIPPGATNLPQIFDSFDLTGPNGLHSVIVTDAVVPLGSLSPYPTSERWRKHVVHGLVNALAQIHSASIVHGDIHVGNVGISLPSLMQAKLEDLQDVLATFDVTIVFPSDPARQTPRIPAYVLEPVLLSKYYHDTNCTKPPCAVLLDFGNASVVGVRPERYHCFPPACAPETLMARTVHNIKIPMIEPPVDIWAIGTLIYELYAFRSLFSYRDVEALSQCMAITDDAPQDWLLWPHKPQTVFPNAEQWWSQCREVLAAKCPDDFEGLLLLLKRIFVTDPTCRISARDLLLDAWFTDLGVAV